LAVSLHLELDPAGARHEALERALRAAIRAGRLAPGTRLPSTRAMAADLGLARGTVVEAYEQLRAEGYLGARHGAGTWVAELAPAAPAAALAAPAGPARPPRFSFHPGQPDLTAFPRAAWAGALRHGLRDVPAPSLGYGDPRGRPELRAALAAYLARARGVVADPERIVVCAGFSHGLALLCRVLRAEGRDVVAMEDPCLSDLREVARAAGMRVVGVSADTRGARTALLGATGAHLAVLGPAHQFPLGAVLHPERRAAAVAWARSTGGLLLEDDYDAELRYDRQPVGALQALDPDHVVYAGTVSKTLAPALRIGWLVVPPRLLEPLTALRAREDVQPSAMDQIAFAQLLTSGAFDHHVRRMRTRYRRRRDRLVAMLAERAPAVAPVGISAGLRVLLQLPRGAPPATELARRASERSVQLFPIGPYHHDGRPVRDGIVAGYAALPEHDFEAGIAALGDLLAV
jgi:GntR family transcriptional regulator / MocR family aminotransferase